MSQPSFPCSVNENIASLMCCSLSLLLKQQANPKVFSYSIFAFKVSLFLPQSYYSICCHSVCVCLFLWVYSSVQPWRELTGCWGVIKFVQSSGTKHTSSGNQEPSPRFLSAELSFFPAYFLYWTTKQWNLSFLSAKGSPTSLTDRKKAEHLERSLLVQL